MQEFNPEVDEITQAVTMYMHRIYAEYQALAIDVRSDYKKGAAMIAFRLAFEYFEAARDTLLKNQVIGGGALTRACTENLSDLFYIYDKPEKYPKAYVDSMEEFRNVMVAAAGKGTKTIFDSRELKQANKWTRASIEDRIVASGKALINIYDMFSYFSHPNPGSITYLTNKELKRKQINLLKQSNCLVALTLMGVILNHSDLKSVSIDELDDQARKLGTQLKPD